jgi:hypothetical protein
VASAVPCTFWKSVPHQVRANPQFTLCCAQGKVMLPPLEPPPEPLKLLFIRNKANAKDFCQRIRSYNNALAFTSMGANLDTSVAQPGNYTYRLRDEFYHRMGSLLPQPGEAPKFAQLYINDSHAELDGQMGNFGGLNRDTMQSLQTMLHACNPYASIYQMAVERLQGRAVDLSLCLLNDRHAELRRTCIHINNELLQKPSNSQNPFFIDAMLQHVRVKLKHGDACGTAFTTYCILVILDEPIAIPLKSIQWYAIMPSIACIWEEKDVMKWRVCNVQGRNALKITINRTHNNVACIYFIHIAPNHQCANFVSSWHIVTLNKIA